jgi:superfamily II DNA or RNA helicase
MTGQLTLYHHQRKLVDLAPDKWLLAWGTGSGKSLAAITICKNKGGDTLVVCPKSLVNKWKDDCNFDVLSKEQFKKQAPNLPYYNNFILDEFHYFSNHKSQLTKSLLNYIKNHNPQNIYGLTATPYLSSTWNLYTYGLIFGRNWNWYKWKTTYFFEIIMGYRVIGNKKIPIKIPKAKQVINGLPLDKEVARLVNCFGNTVSLEDCFDVPEQIFLTEKFELTKEQKKAIDENFDPLPIVNFSKESQISGGTLKGDAYIEDQFFKSEKMDRCLDIIQEHKKVIVVCHYNNEIDVLASKVKNKKVFIIRGDVKDRHSVVQEAEACDNCVLFAQSACSEGWEIPSFPIMVFYSYDFSLKNYVQMMGRIQRAGHIKKNVYISLVTEKTVDEDIWNTVVNKKMDFQTSIYEKNRGTTNN